VDSVNTFEVVVYTLLFLVATITIPVIFFYLWDKEDI
tara:strand:+ start:836 stop:946 length:111 start_codon:yes stop_codon:yes gene_type:complete